MCLQHSVGWPEDLRFWDPDSCCISRAQLGPDQAGGLESLHLDSPGVSWLWLLGMSPTLFEHHIHQWKNRVVMSSV